MAEINVTPLVDVMLVLLIIFMVTAPLMTSGVQVNLPESKAAPVEQEQQPVSLTIDTTGALFIDDQPVAPEALPQRLAAIRAASPEPNGPRVQLRADRSLDYGRVMAVMSELNRAGLRRIALIGAAEAGR